jgi:endonuclease YncB( thermonuclease family)
MAIGSRVKALVNSARAWRLSLHNAHAWASLATSLLLALSLVTSALAETVTGVIVGITDGDTLTLLTPAKAQLKIRLAEIDAPESGQPWGKKSKAMLSALAYGRQARLVITDKDRYGRFVARVYIGSTDVNAEMVRRGGAWAFRRYLTDRSILKLEAAAKRGRFGLWSMPPEQIVPPWDWRANRRSVGDDETAVAAEPGTTVSCGSKRYCKQMASCAEATTYLRQCRLLSLDGDGDGVPCESLCSGGLH